MSSIRKLAHNSFLANRNLHSFLHKLRVWSISGLLMISLLATLQRASSVYAVSEVRVFVANQFSNTVSVISTSTDTVIATIPVGQFPKDIAITPDGSKAYVTNYQSNNVSVISISTNT